MTFSIKLLMFFVAWCAVVVWFACWLFNFDSAEFAKWWPVFVDGFRGRPWQTYTSISAHSWGGTARFFFIVFFVMGLFFSALAGLAFLGKSEVSE